MLKVSVSLPFLTCTDLYSLTHDSLQISLKPEKFLSTWHHYDLTFIIPTSCLDSDSYVSHFKKKKVYLFLAVSGLSCFMWNLSLQCTGFPLVMACGLQSAWASVVALPHVGSELQGGTKGSQNLNYWTIREVSPLPCLRTLVISLSALGKFKITSLFWYQLISNLNPIIYFDCPLPCNLRYS